MENTTHLFLAVRFNCNKCHDHPFERWTQDQYYQTAAYFARVDLKRDPASGNRNIGGSEVEAAKPLYEEVVDKPSGEVEHQRTGAVAAPKLPFQAARRARSRTPRAASNWPRGSRRRAIRTSRGRTSIASGATSSASASSSRSTISAQATRPRMPHCSTT